MNATKSKSILSDGVVRGIRELVSHYPSRDAAIVPALVLAQSDLGYISDGAIEAIARELSVPPIRVAQTASFYPMIRRSPVGKYLIQVCNTLPCSLMGADHVVEYLKDKLKIDVGGTTPDGRFTLTKVECLASCGTAPVMMINDELYESLTEEKIDRILDSLE
ncbi:MAG: NADH-quinone oxidoreductase subunit NuoE [bacterium]